MLKNYPLLNQNTDQYIYIQMIHVVGPLCWRFSIFWISSGVLIMNQFTVAPMDLVILEIFFSFIEFIHTTLLLINYYQPISPNPQRLVTWKHLGTHSSLSRVPIGRFGLHTPLRGSINLITCVTIKVMDVLDGFIAHIIWFCYTDTFFKPVYTW